MTIELIYAKDSFELAHIQVMQDRYEEHTELTVPELRKFWREIADTIDGIYTNGASVKVDDKKLTQKQISDIIQDTFPGMDRRTVSKARVYSQNFDAIMEHLDNVTSMSCSIERMVSLWQSKRKKVKSILFRKFNQNPADTVDGRHNPLLFKNFQKDTKEIEGVYTSPEYDGQDRLTSKELSPQDNASNFGASGFKVLQGLNDNAFTPTEIDKILVICSDITNAGIKALEVKKVVNQ